MWVDGRIYFRSDRDGEFNVYSYDPATKKVSRLTTHADFPVVNASAGGGMIIYQQAGYLHLLHPRNGGDSRPQIREDNHLSQAQPLVLQVNKDSRNVDVHAD